MDKKPTSSLVVALGKALNGTLPSLYGRQVIWPSNLAVVLAESDISLANSIFSWSCSVWMSLVGLGPHYG